MSMEDFATALQKYEDRIGKANHVDSKQLALNYLFPLIRKLAGAVGETLAEHSQAIEDIEDALSSDGDVLVQARNTIMLLSGLLDETMVAAGFYTATPQGLKDTGKAPEALRVKFVEAATHVVAAMQAIEDELNGDEEDDEVDADGVDGAQADGERQSGGAEAAGADTTATVLAFAREPDAIIDGDDAQGAAVATSTSPSTSSNGAATNAAQ